MKMQLSNNATKSIISTTSRRLAMVLAVVPTVGTGASTVEVESPSVAIVSDGYNSVLVETLPNNEVRLAHRTHKWEVQVIKADRDAARYLIAVMG